MKQKTFEFEGTNISKQDSIAENICILDASMRIVAVNNSWCEFADANLLDLENYGIGLNYLEICESAAIAGEKGAKEFAEGIRRVDNGDISNFIYEYPCHSPESERWFIGRVTRLLNTDMARVIITHEDITERKKAEELNKKYARELKESYSEKDRILSFISHDLKNTFHGLLGLSEVLEHSSNNLEKREVTEISRELNKAVKEQYKQLENLLTWSRMQLGQVSLKSENIVLNEIIDENLELLKPYYAKKSIRIVTQIENIEISTDRTFLNSILQNLLMNAIKFTHAQGVITIYTHLGDELLEIMVNDTGTGISEEDIKKLFNITTHFTIKGTGGESGSGFGLLMCKEMAEKIGGEITVKSKMGEGSTFGLSIPVLYVNQK